MISETCRAKLLAMKTTSFSSLLYRYKLIRRRVVWLIGQWIPVKFKSDLRPVLYEIILSLMQDPDLVVSGDRHRVGFNFFFSSFSKNCWLFLMTAKVRSQLYKPSLKVKLPCCLLSKHKDSDDLFCLFLIWFSCFHLPILHTYLTELNIILYSPVYTIQVTKSREHICVTLLYLFYLTIWVNVSNCIVTPLSYTLTGIINSCLSSVFYFFRQCGKKRLFVRCSRILHSCLESWCLC